MLAYDGSEFHGWQVQPGLATIQGALAEAIARVTGETVLPQGSGRTDAGVHALAQVASFQLGSPIPATNLATALNDVLPSAIRVLQAEEAAVDFHARHSARAKTYRYRIFREDICPPFLARYVFHYPYPLNEEAMQSAAGVILGEHDFTSFMAVDPERGVSNSNREDGERSNVRTVFVSRWERKEEELIYTIRGNGFLHHMVRNLVGIFLLVGKRGLDAAGIERILQSKKRSAAGATVPASGLYLVSVEY